MNESDILKEYKTLYKSGGVNSSFSTNKSRGKSQEATRGNQSNLSNEWIPTEAVRCIQKIKEMFNG